jgi:transposase-like protein
MPTLLEVCAEFSTDERCRELLTRLRFEGGGVVCLRCGFDDMARLSPKLWFCRKCEYKFSVTVGTIFADSHLPLLTWFAATYLICESRKGMSANQLKRMLGVSYKTAWYLCHRIRAAMVEAERVPLDGTVEIDETYVGGRQKGKGRGAFGSEKEIVIGIRQRGGEVRFFHVEDIKSGTLEKYIKENVSRDVQAIITDEHASYPAAIEGNPLFGDYRGKHKTVNHSAGVYVQGDVHTNTVENSFSLLKRGIMGTWHNISAKHLLRYLHEMEFRFNRRHQKDIFTDTLRYMVKTDPLRFAELVA